jgi:hypothetical protein
MTSFHSDLMAELPTPLLVRIGKGLTVAIVDVETNVVHAICPC